MEAGTIVSGKYRIVRLLGAGGMGSVYEAEVDGGDTVALKVINSADIAKNPVLVARFQNEAKATSAIETEHIVHVVDAGVDDASGMPFMAMELLRGEDTQQLLDRFNMLRPELAVRIAAQACVGLQQAHETSVVHRDIKPANLFLADKDGGDIIVKILDFGVAKIKADQADNAAISGLTRTGSMLGSPLYMSPEQARGHKTIDYRADIWSLGVVLYQMLCGVTPHHEIDALGELIIAICSDPPMPVQERAPWVPAEVAEVVHHALHFDPADRYQSAEEMHKALMALLPEGSALNKSQLWPLSADEKAVVAPKREALAANVAVGPAAPKDDAEDLAETRAIAPPVTSDEKGRTSTPPGPTPEPAHDRSPRNEVHATQEAEERDGLSPTALAVVAAAITVILLSIAAAGFLFWGDDKPASHSNEESSAPVLPTAATPSAIPASPKAEETSQAAPPTSAAPSTSAGPPGVSNPSAVAPPAAPSPSLVASPPPVAPPAPPPAPPTAPAPPPAPPAPEAGTGDGEVYE